MGRPLETGGPWFETRRLRAAPHHEAGERTANDNIQDEARNSCGIVPDDDYITGL